MKIICVLSIFCCVVYASNTFTYTNEELTKQREALAIWVSLPEKMEASSKEEQIEKLGNGIRKLSNERLFSPDEANEVRKILLDSVLVIPGHAEYFRDRILQKRLEYEAVKGRVHIDVEAKKRFSLSDMQDDGFRTLACLPSVETVRVLCEFLSDERGYIKLPPNPTLNDMEATAGLYPNCKMAAKALSTLPFVFKPLNKKWSNVTFEDVHPWRLWYEQIKAGNRTFRFEGDPTEYDLNGPAPKEKIARIERDLKRDQGRLAGHRKSDAVSESVPVVSASRKPSTIAAILAACALVAAAFWYFLRGRRTESGGSHCQTKTRRHFRLPQRAAENQGHEEAHGEGGGAQGLRQRRVREPDCSHPFSRDE
jgi:hypothetical protein